MQNRVKLQPSFIKENPMRKGSLPSLSTNILKVQILCRDIETFPLLVAKIQTKGSSISLPFENFEFWAS